MSPQKILILLVNYFNETETCSFVREQVSPQQEGNLEVIIVDNGSIDHDILSKLSDEFAWVYLCMASENLGYLPGAAFGLKNYLGKGYDLPDFVILANSDIAFANDWFFKELLEGNERSGYDMIGPDIFSDMLYQHQNPFMLARIPVQKLRMLVFLSSGAMLHYLFLIYYYSKSRIISMFRNETLEFRELIPVYGIHGSFIIFSRSFFEKGGNLDFPLHLFGEEIFLAEMALRHGMVVGFDPNLKIIHHEHGTTGAFKSRKAVKQMNRSYRYLLDHRKRQ